MLICHSTTAHLVVSLELFRCPDVGLQFAKDPRGYVDLLRFIIRSGSSFSKRDDYHPVVSEHFDKIFGIPRNAGETSQLPVPRAIRAFQTQAQHSKSQSLRFITSSESEKGTNSVKLCLDRSKPVHCDVCMAHSRSHCSFLSQSHSSYHLADSRNRVVRNECTILESFDPKLLDSSYLKLSIK